MKKVLTIGVLMISFFAFAQQKPKTKVVNEKDPICGMRTDQFLKDTAIYQKKVYGFCHASCKAEFKKNPKKHLHQNKTKY